jgi:hypothetical protein
MDEVRIVGVIVAGLILYWVGIWKVARYRRAEDRGIQAAKKIEREVSVKEKV